MHYLNMVRLCPSTTPVFRMTVSSQSIILPIEIFIRPSPTVQISINSIHPDLTELVFDILTGGSEHLSLVFMTI